LRKKAQQTRFTRQKNRTTDLIYKSNKISISIHQATYSYTFALSVDRFIYSRSSKLSIRILTVDV
jgi:ribonuclease HIII